MAWVAGLGDAVAAREQATGPEREQQEDAEVRAEDVHREQEPQDNEYLAPQPRCIEGPKSVF